MHTLADLLAPARCAMCLQPCSGGICPWCEAALPGLERLRCRVCATGWQAPRAGTPCPPCRRAAPAFDATIAVADYAAGPDRLIQRLKYRNQPGLARALGQLLARKTRNQTQSPAWPDRLIAVPLSPQRLRERGYNQASLLARVVGRALAVPVDHHSLRRIASGPFGQVTQTNQPQTGKPRGRRIAESVRQFVARPAVAGQRIALVDDVMTNGATLQACALGLREAGASRVVNLVVARTAIDRRAKSDDA